MTLRARRIDRDGDEMQLLSFDGKTFELSSAKACAPGQPITLKLPLSGEPTLMLKSIGSKREPDGQFRVRARVVSLTRELRAALATCF